MHLLHICNKRYYQAKYSYELHNRLLDIAMFEFDGQSSRICELIEQE